MAAKRFLVRGRVQGVYYRASTKAKAEALGLRGYARNLPDGGVEVLAAGAGSALAELEAWLWQGPPRARVESVVAEEVDVDPPAGFITR